MIMYSNDIDRLRIGDDKEDKFTHVSTKNFEHVIEEKKSNWMLNYVVLKFSFYGTNMRDISKKNIKIKFFYKFGKFWSNNFSYRKLLCRND